MSRRDPVNESPSPSHEQYFGSRHVTILEARPRIAWPNARELWSYRELFWVLISRDVRVRYKQTVLGAGWALLRPLLSTLVFTVVFGRLAKLPSEGAPYPIFALAGVLPWTYFSTAVGSAADSLVGSQQLVTKIYFPRLIIPLSSAGSSLVDLGVGLVLLMGIAFAYGYPPSWGLLWLPLLVLLLVLSGLGPGTMFAALNVAFRDFRHLVPFTLQLWLYATPVVYPPSLFPERWRWLVYLNPATGPVEAFRAVFLHRAPDMRGLAVSAAVSLGLLILALTFFSRTERRFADVI